MTRKKVLIIKFGAIGDIVHSTIIPQSIKNAHPEYEIHYLTSAGYTPLLENCNDIDKIIKYNGNIWNTISSLRKEHYDVILGLNHTLKICLLTYLSFPKQIVFRGYEGASWVENYFYTPKKVFNDITLPDRLQLSATENTHIQKMLNSYPKPHIIVNPGSVFNNNREGRIWDIKKWKDLTNELIAIYGGTVFVTGSLAERPYHLELKRENVIVLSGKYTLKESCSVISLSDLVISGDSGPIHIASAYNIPTIQLLGSTSPDKIKPYGDNGYFIEPKTECKYCWKKKCPYLEENELYAPCINSISVNDVIKKIDKEIILEKATKLLA